MIRKAEQEARYQEEMGAEAFGEQLIQTARRKNRWTCACKHEYYDHHIYRETSSGEYRTGGCYVNDCPCTKFRNPHADPDSVPQDVWEYMLRKDGIWTER